MKKFLSEEDINIKNKNIKRKHIGKSGTAAGYFNTTQMDAISRCRFYFVLIFGIILFIMLTLLGCMNGPVVSFQKKIPILQTCPHEFLSINANKCILNDILTNKNQTNLYESIENNLNNAFYESIYEDNQTIITNLHTSLLCLYNQCNLEEKTSEHVLNYYLNNTLLLEQHFLIQIKDLEKINRYLYLELYLQNLNITKDTYNYYIQTRTYITGLEEDSIDNNNNNSRKWESNFFTEDTHSILCRKGKLICDKIVLFRLSTIEYSLFDIDIFINRTHSQNIITNNNLINQSSNTMNYNLPEFSIRYGNEKFTLWLIGFKTVFLFISIVSLIYYILLLRRILKHERTFEQKWLFLLSISLIFFNNPFYGIELATTDDAEIFFKVFHAISQVIFYILLLSFWLINMDRIRLIVMDIRQNKCLFYGKKLFYMILLFIIMMSTFIYIMINDDNDPMINPIKITKYYTTFLSFIIPFCIIYILWIFYIVFYSIKNIHVMNYRFRFFLCISFLVFLISIVGLCRGGFYPIPLHPGYWTGFYSLMNIYIITLSYLFAPSSTNITVSEQSNVVQMVALSPHSKRSEMAGKQLDAMEDSSNPDDEEEDEEEIVLSENTRSVA